MSGRSTFSILGTLHAPFQRMQSQNNQVYYLGFLMVTPQGRNGQAPQPQYFECVAHGDEGHALAGAPAGSQVAAEGNLRSRSYQDSKGTTRYQANLNINAVVVGPAVQRQPQAAAQPQQRGPGPGGPQGGGQPQGGGGGWGGQPGGGGPPPHGATAAPANNGWQGAPPPTHPTQPQGGYPPPPQTYVAAAPGAPGLDDIPF